MGDYYEILLFVLAVVGGFIVGAASIYPHAVQEGRAQKEAELARQSKEQEFLKIFESIIGGKNA